MNKIELYSLCFAFRIFCKYNDKMEGEMKLCIACTKNDCISKNKSVLLSDRGNCYE